eukprot:CAMPEP_0118923580 /NCGR_PEP_ID=MMETSP1169-20130426/2051_1 /TAXON_ID=36882 /ORGANISM="Pyramimonas obovata, Strain CCMP722" /LENGTH=322 /DNA_ID=CAMNT_0006864593 /DNA_START=187 /DNA_END=1155 /DNA_ORIENTATION=+
MTGLQTFCAPRHSLLAPSPSGRPVESVSRLQVSTCKPYYSALKTKTAAAPRLWRGRHQARHSGVVCAAIAPNDRPPSIDVSGVCVDPVFRSNESVVEEEVQNAARTKARILFVSEGNVCRSVLAEAIMTQMLVDNGLSDRVECASRATRDYNVGEGPEQAASVVAKEMGLTLREGTAAVFDHTREIVKYDMLLAVDKFTLADVMREVSVYDTVDASRNFCSRVRHLGEYSRGRQIKDVDDPLYNGGAGDEVEAVREAATQIHGCCKGLIRLLLELEEISGEGAPLRPGLLAHLKGLKEVDWLKPPMLGGGKKKDGDSDMEFI